MTKPSRSATHFTTAATAAPTRPTSPITIGSQTYTARAPKIDVWREVTTLLSKVDYARELADVAEEDITPEQQGKLLDIHQDLGEIGKMEEAIIVGRELRDSETGELLGLEGGFLRRCLTKADWRALYREWKDDDSVIDLETMFIAAKTLATEFSPYFEQRHDAIELPLPAGHTTSSTRAKRTSKTK